MDRGFLGNDASFMLDVVVTALVLIVPVLLLSIGLVKRRHAYRVHRRLQLGLAAVLLVAVVAFEIDLQIVHRGWINVVNRDPDLPRLTGSGLQSVRTLLHVHLWFAVSTPLLWAITIAHAIRHYGNPPRPKGDYRLHMLLGWLSTIDLILTTVTGLAFYYAAFVAVHRH